MGGRRDAPAAGQRFHGLVRLNRLQAGPQVPDLAGRRATRAQQPAVVHEATTDARPDRDKKHAAPPLPGSEMRFGQRGRIAVVAQHGRNAQVLAAPVGQVEILPARGPDGS